MTYRGSIKNGKIILDGSPSLPEGAPVKVEVSPRSKRPKRILSLGEKLLKFAGTAKGLPHDLAKNHDHYLHRRPKKP
jgi:hypothetical protein